MPSKVKADIVAVWYENSYKEQLTAYFTTLNPDSIGNNSLVTGMLDRSERKNREGMKSLEDEMGKMTPEHIQSVLMNPFYAIQVVPELVEEHSPPLREDEWAKANASLIQEMGAEKWLTHLLDVLQGNPVTADERLNPFQVINIDPVFAEEHPPVVKKEQWVQANVMLISQLGTEKWLVQLLDILEGDFITAEDVHSESALNRGQLRFRAGKPKRKKNKKYKK